MKQTAAKQYAKIHPCLPVQRGNVRISNIVFINAVRYVLENGCKWRALPERFDKWQTVYARFRRWSRSGVLKRLFAALREQEADCFGLDSTGARKTNEPLAMDRACEGDETRQLVRDLGMTPVVPPKANRKAEWNYDQETYKMRNEIERLFRRFKGCRRIFTRFDKLDATYPGFVCLVAVVEMMLDLAWTGPSGIFQSDSSLFWRETTRRAELAVQFQGFASFPLSSSMNSKSGFSIRLMESQSPLRSQQASNGILCVEPTTSCKKKQAPRQSFEF